jgi:hypothetical protein
MDLVSMSLSGGKHRRYSHWSRIGLLTMAAFACIGFPLQAMAFASLNWTEEVKLEDGRVIQMKRYQEFHGATEPFRPPGPSDYWVEFKNPDTQEVVRWKSDRSLQLIAISVESGTPELLLQPEYDGLMRWKCPSPLLVAFQYRNREWVNVPLTSLRRKIVHANVLFEVTLMREIIRENRRHLTTETVHQALPIKYKYGVVDLSDLKEQEFMKNCNGPFDYGVRKEASVP